MSGQSLLNNASSERKKLMRNYSTGIYIHIPFCIRKCNYCDFFSVPLPAKEYLQRYTNALVAEISQRAHEGAGKKIESVYFGGGTPSLLSTEQLETIIRALDDNFRLPADMEISMEANPASLNARKIQDFTNARINRLSLGVQSFSNDDLRVLTRIHSAEDVRVLIDILHSQGLENFNIDLIYGIPGQSMDRWIKSLQTAADSSPMHISMYLLQLDPGTPMAMDIKKGRMAMLDEERELEMYTLGREYLQGRGFDHYEISNFSFPGRECKHNLIYWQAGEYIGIGCGAVSFMDKSRFINKPDLKAYLYAIENRQERPVEEIEKMSHKGLIADAIILGLRLCSGINMEKFRSRYGIDISREYSEVIKSCSQKGLLKIENGQISLTRKGYFLSNEVLCQFIA